MKRPRLSIAALAVLLLLFSTAPAQAQTALTVGEPISGTLEEGAVHLAYALDVADDSFLYLEVDQLTVDVVVRLLDPEGEQVAEIDGPARGPERLIRRIEEGGAYRVEVAPFEEATGDFEIVLRRLEPLESDPARLTDQLLSPYDGDDTPGAAVQVWRNGETLFSKAYGMADLTHDIPFETTTRTNIGSTSKQFTAFAIMLLAERGELSLDDPIREHLPELPELTDPITVRHLLTHTSGLREFLNLLVMTGRRLDHGDWIDRAELIAIVQRQPALQNEPGTEFNYNNTAYGLAATIVERISGQDFHEFMQDNVFGPLDMGGTMVRPTPEHIVPNSSEGYTPGPDGYREIGDLGGAVGAGGIYSTVEDLQTWVENYSDPHIGSEAVVAEMMKAYELPDDDDPDQGYGLGLMIDEQRGLRRVHHGGADVAHRSMLVYYPEIDAGITTQSNHASFDSGLAYELAEAFFADAMEPEEEEEETGGDFDPADFDPEDFDDFAGRYALDAAPDFILTFTREDDTYYTQATGQSRLEMVPVSPVRFRLSQVEAEVEFERNEEGEVDGAILFQNGEQHATRIEGGAWEPTPEELAAFTGRYYSAELETFYTLVLEDDELTVKHRRLDDFTLGAGEQDRFSGGNLQFEFERDRNGQVIGFYLANGRTRDVRFERQE